MIKRVTLDLGKNYDAFIMVNHWIAIKRQEIPSKLFTLEQSFYHVLAMHDMTYDPRNNTFTLSEEMLSFILLSYDHD